MSLTITIENMYNEDEHKVPSELNTKNFCSKECVEDFLLDEFEVEGITVTNNTIVNLPTCCITIFETEDETLCEYGCD